MVSRRHLLKLSALGTASFAAPLAYSASNITMTHNTGNPIGSTSPKDLSDNARNLDYLCLGPGQTYLDRKGVPRKSWSGMESEHSADQARRECEFGEGQSMRAERFDRFMASSGYSSIGDYGVGLLIEHHSQYFMKDGQPYRLSSIASVPYTATGHWSTESDAFVLLGDDVLRQDLANPAGPSKGSEMVGYMADGAGAGGRTVSERLRETVYVKDFRAVGDGKVNDYLAIRSAILAANGKRLVFDRAVAYRIDGAGSLMVFGPDDLPDGITIDFRGQKIIWTGSRLTDGSQGGQYATNWGIFTFRGAEAASFSVTIESALTPPIPFLPEPSFHTLKVGDCVLIQSLAPGVADGQDQFKDRVINRSAQISRISGGNIYFDNRFWFDLVAGSKITYTKLNTLRNVHILNASYTDNSEYGHIGRSDGTSFVVLEACEDSSALEVNATGVPKHVVSIVRSRAIEVSGYVNDPKETVQGGYFTQIVQSSRVFIHDARGRNERHIVDITASAYVSVERSGSFATKNATFTTHGAYEHDLSYDNCFGYMSFSNSGPIFGSSTRKVDVSNHDGTNLNFGQFSHQGLSDATFRNCQFPSESYISLDGVKFENCEFGAVRFAQNSNRSKRSNIFENTALILHPDAMSSSAVGVGCPVTTAKVKLQDCNTKFVTPPTLSGGELIIASGVMELSGSPTFAIPVRVFGGAKLINNSTSGGVGLSVQSDLVVDDSDLLGFGLRFEGVSDQRVLLTNARMDFPSPGVTATCFDITKTGGKLNLSVQGGSYDRRNAEARVITVFTPGATLQLIFSGVTLANGEVRIEPGILGSGKNALIYTDIIEDAITKPIFPVTGPHIGIGFVMPV